MSRYFKLKQPKRGTSNSRECLNICSGNRFCTLPVSKVMCCKHYDHPDLDLRWPVCEKHAKTFHFKHMGTPVHFEELGDGDISANWVELKSKN
jgi:hypothetical protein